MRLPFAYIVSAAVATTTYCGCDSPPSRVEQISFTPTDVAAKLIETGDKDKNGNLSTQELKDVPYIAVMANAYDKDRDHQVTAEEISERLTAVVFDPRKAMSTGECVVMRKGSPFAGALVKLTPAPGLEDQLPSATGTTDNTGIARLKMGEEHRPQNAPHVTGLIRPGLYWVEVTHASISVPPRYNTETTLGAEVSEASLTNGPFLIKLDF
jgi:hypothetical protein